MFYYFSSKPLLLVVFIVLLNGHNWAKEVVGIMGNGITIPFSFDNMSKESVNSIGVYKDSTKIGECNAKLAHNCHAHNCHAHNCHAHNCCSQRQSCFFANKEACFCIRNLTSVDIGTYWITLFQTDRDRPMLKSNEVSLLLEWDGNTTESPSCTPNATDDAVSVHHSTWIVVVPIIFAVLGVPIIALLMGLLGWFCWTNKRSPEWDQLEDLRAKKQASTSMSVYSVEYGVLDFNSRPSGGEGDRHRRERDGGVVRPAETVEYAAITFPPQQRGLDGK